LWPLEWFNEETEKDSITRVTRNNTKSPRFFVLFRVTRVVKFSVAYSGLQLDQFHAIATGYE